MKKRIFCIILSLCLLVTLLPVTGLAASWSNLKAGEIGFHYGNGNFLKITRPTAAGKYTYGTAAGETAAQTAADASTLPDSGWQWAVTKEGDGFRMILNDFNITYSSDTDGLMFYCDLTLELRGSNSITSTTSKEQSVISGNKAALKIMGSGSLHVDADQSQCILAYSGTFAVMSGTVLFTSNYRAVGTSPSRGIGVQVKVSSNKDGSNAKDFTSGSVSSYKWVQLQWVSQGDYNISVSRTSAYQFSYLVTGYTEVSSPLQVAITNIGAKATGELTVALSGDNADSFTLSKTTIPSIASACDDSFSVQPKLGLAVGKHKATVMVSGSNIETKTFDVAIEIKKEKPVNFGSKTINSVDDLKTIASNTGAFTVSEADGIVTIKLLHDVEGRLDINYQDAYIIIDANGKIFDGVGTNQAITMEHRKNITVELTGEGSFLPGTDSTIFVGYESTLIIRSATIEGKLYKYGSNSIVKFVVEGDNAYYTVKKNGADLGDPYYADERKLSSSTGSGDVLTVAQVADAIPGDMDLNAKVTTDDAVYLLLRVMFGDEDYPMHKSLNPDVDGNNQMNTDDAVYLLLHAMFGAGDYPLAG